MNSKLSYPGSLHNHTHYSNLRLRDCIIKEKDLIDYAIELGHDVVAITDHETIASHIKVQKYYKKVKEEHPDFKVILGNEIYLVRNGLNADNFNKDFDRYYHFILLAKDAIGHQQIREISTRAWHRSYMARGMRRVPTYYQDLFDIIGKNPGHVIGSTACLGGAIPTQLLKNKDLKSAELGDKIIKWCLQMKDLFGKDNFYLELQPNESREQTYVNRQLIGLSNLLDIPYIITTDSHYLKKEDAKIHEAFLNAQDGDREVKSFYATTYMMDTEELESHMDLTEEELQTAYRNIKRIKDSCEDYNLLKPLKIPQLMWKDLRSYIIDQRYWCSEIPYLEKFWSSDYEGDEELADAIVLKIESDERLQNKEIYEAVNECLEMTWISSEVNKTHWSAYYLNLQKIIEECWNAGTLVGCGRGSGVGFILLYLLDITQINPKWETTQTFAWRFLNPDRVSVLDVDVDIEGGRRAQVLEHLRKVYGEDRVANVATFGTEQSKSAILTACRGLGIDVDIAQYLSSMIVADRGQLRSLSQTFYGDEEAGFAPNDKFVAEMTNNYPEVWAVAKKIEGLICRLGEHAGGVIFVDEPFTNSTALMRAPNGDIITQYDLHDCEDVSLIKYDLLSVEALDKMHICLDLLAEQNYIDGTKPLRQLYEDTIGIYNLERTAPDMWKMVWNHDILSLFQMEKQSGVQGIALVKPESVDDLATLNSVIRLMAQEKGAEQPLNKFARFKKNINLWYKEMKDYGLTKEQMEILEPVVKLSYGICESQEGFMQLVQMPECGGFNLTWADRLRKSIAKKNPAEYEKLQKEYFATVAEKGLDQKLCNYVWNVLVATSRGYGFNKSHTLAYSLIALQEMNLAYRFPLIFWNCACLISDSGGAEKENEEENEEQIIWEETYDTAIDFAGEDDEDDDEDDEDEEITTTTKKKKKTKANNYGKIAAAIGKMKAQGVSITLPDINKSRYTFYPDVELNTIRYGMSGITRIGEDLIKTIIANRPYDSIEDFLGKVKINKPQMVNLIKAGAFDFLGDRKDIALEYIKAVSDTKKRVTLQNMKMLIDFGLIPDEYDMERRVYNFNKYLKKFKNGEYFIIDDIAFNFYEQHFDMDKLVSTENGFMIKQTVWDKIYQKHMDIIRPFVKKNSEQLLEAMNNRIISDNWNKYFSGSISKWEMDAISCYFHEHELAATKITRYNIKNFGKLPEQPEVAFMYEKKGQSIPIFEITRICGTVLDKDKNKNLITLLTTDGVVEVKLFGPVFNNYNKQISVKNEATGKKTVIEKSWLSRGNKIIVTGMRRENMFIAKKYKNTPYHLVELITEIAEDGSIKTVGERADVE